MGDGHGKTKRKRNKWRGPIYGVEAVYAVVFWLG